VGTGIESRWRGEPGIRHRLELPCPVLRLPSAHVAAVLRRFWFVILVVKLAFSSARFRGDEIVVTEEQTLPRLFTARIFLAWDEFGWGVGARVVIGGQQPNLVVDTGTGPRVLVPGKAQGLRIQERKCGLGVVSRGNIAAPLELARKAG
jgi:hypothetical protein